MEALRTNWQAAITAVLDTDPAANRLNTLGSFPELYPNAGQVSSSYYDYQVLQAEKPPFWDGKSEICLPSSVGAA